MAATGPDDVWVVGYAPSGPDTTFTEHWDGSRWTVVASPNGPSRRSSLSGVTAVSPSDVWAVGYARTANDGNGLTSQSQVPRTEHWDGHAWSIVSREYPTRWSVPIGASAVSSTDIWAVGRRQTYQSFQNLYLHWDGKRWR